jgi:hypothetical protein
MLNISTKLQCVEKGLSVLVHYESAELTLLGEEGEDGVRKAARLVKNRRSFSCIS